jgi:hypothetical protein
MKHTLQRSLFEEQETAAEPNPDPVPAPPDDPVITIVKPDVSHTIRRVPAATAESWVACKNLNDCEWVAFLREYGRVPLVSDRKKPWEYSGWLMYYRIMAEEYLDIPKRWDYWYRTMAAGRLLDEPIPKIHFTGGELGDRSEGYKLIEQWIRLVDRYGGGWSSPMTVLLDWLLWGFGLAAEKPSVSTELDEQLYRTVNLGPLLLKPYDYLGAWIADQKGKWNPNAFYPTPSHVVELMVEMNFTGVDPAEARNLTVCDPCLGSARFLMQSSNYSLRLFGMDVDLQLVKASQANGALYVPWLVRPFPEEFFAQVSPR